MLNLTSTHTFHEQYSDKFGIIAQELQPLMWAYNYISEKIPGFVMEVPKDNKDYPCMAFPADPVGFDEINKILTIKVNIGFSDIRTVLDFFIKFSEEEKEIDDDIKDLSPQEMQYIKVKKGLENYYSMILEKDDIDAEYNTVFSLFCGEGEIESPITNALMVDYGFYEFIVDVNKNDVLHTLIGCETVIFEVRFYPNKQTTAELINCRLSTEYIDFDNHEDIFIEKEGDSKSLDVCRKQAQILKHTWGTILASRHVNRILHNIYMQLEDVNDECSTAGLFEFNSTGNDYMFEESYLDEPEVEDIYFDFQSMGIEFPELKYHIDNEYVDESEIEESDTSTEIEIETDEDMGD